MAGKEICRIMVRSQNRPPVRGRWSLGFPVYAVFAGKGTDNVVDIFPYFLGLFPVMLQKIAFLFRDPFTGSVVRRKRRDIRIIRSFTRKLLRYERILIFCCHNQHGSVVNAI